MFLYLIRHGKPDYDTDTLLPEGEEQARLVAKRLVLSGLDEIHSSPMGRARQTAAPTAEALGLPVIIEPWARELGDESRTTFPDGVSKIISSLPHAYYHQPAFRRIPLEEAFDAIEGMRESHFKERYANIASGIDALIATNGYRRNADGLYDVVAPLERHVALFCHAGMMRVILSHLFHVPYQFFASVLQLHFTGITLLNFETHRINQKTTSPVLISYGDVGHLYTDGHVPVHYASKLPF